MRVFDGEWMGGGRDAPALGCAQHPLPEPQDSESYDQDTSRVENRAGPEQVSNLDGTAAEDDCIGRRGNGQHETERGEQGDR